MAKPFMLKQRSRYGARLARKKLLPAHIRELEKVEEHLEKVEQQVEEDIERLEVAEKREHHFAFIGGKFSVLMLQDFIGAVFGAMFFAVTQEVWEIGIKIDAVQTFVILLLSLITGFGLVYFSRRRKIISSRIYHNAFLRTVEVYSISFATSMLFVLVFGLSSQPEIMLKQAVLIALPAVVSAATADLLFF